MRLKLSSAPLINEINLLEELIQNSGWGPHACFSLFYQDFVLIYYFEHARCMNISLCVIRVFAVTEFVLMRSCCIQFVQEKSIQARAI